MQGEKPLAHHVALVAMELRHVGCVVFANFVHGRSEVVPCFLDSGHVGLSDELVRALGSVGVIVTVRGSAAVAVDAKRFAISFVDPENERIADDLSRGFALESTLGRRAVAGVAKLVRSPTIT